MVYGLAPLAKIGPFYKQSREGLETAADFTRYML
jgi:hypothetical protein